MPLHYTLLPIVDIRNEKLRWKTVNKERGEKMAKKERKKMKNE